MKSDTKNEYNRGPCRPGIVDDLIRVDNLVLSEV